MRIVISVFHWVSAVVKILLLLILLPFALIFFALRWLVCRACLTSKLRSAGMARGTAKLFAAELSPVKFIGDIADN